MKHLLGSSLLRNNFRFAVMLVLTFQQTQTCGQIINYVNNPSFELALPSVTFTPYEAAKFWGALDSTFSGSHRLRAKFLNTVPNGFGGYQLPKSGNNFIGTNFYCDSTSCGKLEVRWYPRNRLKKTLTANKIYCAKYHIVCTNNSPLGINSFGAFFGGTWMDTTKYCNTPITYLNPQVEYFASVFTDTLNWTAFSGTFIATGTEKYMVLGNFRSNVATQTLLINPNSLPALGADILIDDVSLIEMNLPAFAGNDTAIVPGDSAFIGRTPDVGIDEACQWFKLPNMTIAFDTVAGLWVKPTTTATYVVRQQLWCSGVKWDTVVIYMNPVGLPNEYLNDKIELYPQPAFDELTLQIKVDPEAEKFNFFCIYNHLGQPIKQEEIVFENQRFDIDITDLPSGVYTLRLRTTTAKSVMKKFVVQR